MGIPIRRQQKSGAFHAEDGSEGYIYSDGSGYYKGADGSDGYIYSDGSGYYRGADGSDGYKYSDGSGYFRGGSNEVDAYQYSDGSGYYGDSKHSKSHYWPIEKSKDSSSSSGGYSSSSYDDDDGLSFSGYSYYPSSRFSFKKLLRSISKVLNIIKKIIIGILIAAVVGFIAYNIYEISKQTPIGIDSNSIPGQQYESIVVRLVEAGFKNVTTQPLEDLSVDAEQLVGVAEHISIDGEISFTADSEFPNDAKIIVYYHSIKLISPPISSYVAKGEDFNRVLQLYQDAGFVNIKLEVIDDLIFGWFKKDGSVESIAINGETKFSTEYTYRPDAEIVITYHTLKKNEKSQ